MNFGGSLVRNARYAGLHVGVFEDVSCEAVVQET